MRLRGIRGIFTANLAVNMGYIHEQPGWPDLKWDEGRLASTLAAVRFSQGRLLGKMEAMGFAFRDEAGLTTLTRDVVKSSAIEGERLNAEEVRSSIARRLGMDGGKNRPASREVEGIVEMMLDATQHCRLPLTKERLFSWHASLFPAGRSGMRRIVTGAWRNDESGPMQVVSGPLGKERIHFEAVPASRLDAEMDAFVEWFEAPHSIDPILFAGLAHLRFLTIHPFEDGNGRIARAIADLILARSEETERRFYSLSGQVERDRKAYYLQLERAQSGGLDVTAWLDWFLGCLGRAIGSAEETLATILVKAAIWGKANRHPVNERQKIVLNRLLDGFRGHLNTSKYAKLAKCSEDTALRDIKALCEWGILVRNAAGGRSTSYAISD